jgi:uncharacterized membrane protein HdeD (DUF308 family)
VTSNPESPPATPEVAATTAAPEELPASRLRVNISRAAQIVLGLVTIGYAVVVLAAPATSVQALLRVIAVAVALLAAQTALAGGRLVIESWIDRRGPRSWWRTIRSWGVVGVGLLVAALAAFAILDPALAQLSAAIVLASALAIVGFTKIFQASGLAVPGWLRGSLLTTGVLIVVVIALAAVYQNLALAGFAILAGIILIVTGVETVVTGLHPTDPRQFVILKLVLFSAFYGLVLINWIDLFGKDAPAYGIWLLLTYMAPFAVLIVFEGWRSWPLAVSLGLLVSLMNDLGYYFVGNLLFGFHVNLGPWIAGQLGFRGNDFVTYFNAGSWGISVSSWMMGLSIYARVAIVGAILYYWWRHPGEIVARTDTPVPGSPA